VVFKGEWNTFGQRCYPMVGGAGLLRQPKGVLMYKKVKKRCTNPSNDVVLIIGPYQAIWFS